MSPHEPAAPKEEERRPPRTADLRPPRVARAGRSPLAPTEAMERACEHLITEAGDLLESLTTSEEEDALVARARLHPAAIPATLTIASDGRAHWVAPTAPVGPGLHHAMVDLADGLASALACDRFLPTPEEHGTTDTDRAFLRWLREAVAVADASRDPFREVGLPGPLFPSVGEGVATVTGARDAAWVRGLLDGAHDGRDALPWWHEGRGAEFHLGRARVLLAFELRDRPLASEQEAEAYEAISEELAAARRLSEELGPWRYLHAFIESALAGSSDHADERVFHEARLGHPSTFLPYRSGTVHRDVGAGLCIPLDASLVEREDESGIWLGNEERTLRIAGFALPAPMTTEAIFEALELPAPSRETEPPARLPAGARLRISTVEAGASLGAEAGVALPGRALRLRAEWPSGDPTAWVRSLLEGLELR